MKLVMLYGAPGVGKLTTGRKLQKLTGYPLFHNHLTVDLVAAVFDFGTPAFQELRERIWIDVMQRAAREKVPGIIFTFVFEPTVLPGFYDRLTAAVEAEGGVLLPVELRCGPSENARRVAQPDRAAYLKTRNVDDILTGIEAGTFLPPSPLPGNVVIDTTDMEPADTAPLIVERLGLDRA